MGICNEMIVRQIAHSPQQILAHGGASNAFILLYIRQVNKSAALHKAPTRRISALMTAPSKSHGQRSIRATAIPRALMDDQTAAAGAWAARIITLMPQSFPGLLGESILGRALDQGLWALETIDLRPFGEGRHRNVDDTPAGGGAGMVLRADVLGRALDEAIAGTPTDRTEWPVVYLSPRGKRFDQATARRWAGAQGITMLCGRFEGVDERVLEEYQIEEVSLGDFVMTGGEAAAQAMLDATIRLLPGVLGNQDSAIEESHANGLLEHPQYTKPPSWRGRDIPPVLLSGNHAEIEKWRREQSLALTRKRRPDLMPTQPDEAD